MDRSPSGRRRALRALGAAVLATAAGLALPAAAGAGADPDTGPCRPAACSATMTVSGWPTGWRSPQDFYPYNEVVMAKLKVGPRRLKMVSTWGPDGCRHLFRGAGVEAKVKACGPATPLRVRAVSADSLAVRLRIVYQGAASFESNPPGGGGVTRSGAMSRIVGPLGG